jgi:cell division septation protein DedD
MERKIEFDRRKRRVEYYRNMTALLEEKNQEALIRKAEKPEEITVVRPALLPTVPVNPPKTATTGAVGVIIGLILGLVTALVVETFDTSLGAIEDVEQTIGAPVLGVIPQTDAKEVFMGLKEKFPDGIEDLSFIMQSLHIISHFTPMSIIAESFRALRTSIQFKEADHPIKSIGITSASPQEGKTFVSLNFSITMAQAGMKVLLVGADMRKPMLSKALGLENTLGLSDVLLGRYSWRDSIKTSIPTGKPASQPKGWVAGGNEHANRKQETTSAKKSPEKTGKTSNKMAKTPVPRSKSISKSNMKVPGDSKGVQSQHKTSPPKKVASKPRKEAAKESKTIITRSGVISKRNGINENDEKFVWAMSETSFPKLIRAKTIKYRVHGSRTATPQNGSKSDPKAPIVGDEEDVQIQPRTASVKAIVSKTEAETTGFAPIPLTPSPPEETGKRDIIVDGDSKKKPSYPYSLYLGSFRTEERAKRAIEFYSKNGFSAFRTKVEFRGKGVWYRVYGGHFKDADQAYRFREKHELSETKIRKTNYANLVGIYSNKNKLREKISSLEEMGYSPYVIGGKNGESSIFLGAYITKEGTEQQSQDLKSKGISVQVISR